MTLNDREIAQLCDPDTNLQPMLSPFVSDKLCVGSLSRGLGHFGYDICISGTLKRFANRQAYAIDPAGDISHIDDIRYEVQPLDDYILEPGEFILASSLEHFSMPDDVYAQVTDKSTLARLGIAVQNTILEPAWRGSLTIEISNHGKLDIRLREAMPIAQVIFRRGRTPQRLYNGRYQNQQPGTPALSNPGKA